MAKKSPKHPDTSPESGPSIRRFRIGLNVIVQVVLLTVIVGMINALSCRRFVQWDHTPSKRFSLSEQTQQILGSLSEDLYLTVAFSRTSDVYHYTQRMLELYQQAAGDQLHITRLDPLRDPSAVAKLQNQDPRLVFNENKILASKTETLEKIEAHGPEIVPYQIITERDMFQRAENLMFRDGQAQRGNVTQYRLERALTSAILAATQEREQVAYVLTSKSQMRTVQGRNAGGTLVLEGGHRQNLRVEPLPFTENTKIPGDASVVMMISPGVDFSGAELKEIFQEYWQKRKGGLILLLNPFHYDRIPNLRNYLETYYGVRWEDNRVLSVKNQGGRNLVVYEPPGWFQEGSPITETLADHNTPLPKLTSTLNTQIEGQETDTVLAPQATDKKPLIAVSSQNDGFWKESDYKNPNPVAEPREMNQIHVAVSVEIGAGINQDLRLNSSRMVIVGNGNLIDPDLYTRESIEFILNSINWASAREELVTGISVQPGVNYRVDVGDRPYRKLEWMALRLLPGGAFFIGLAVAFFRRR